MVLSFLTSLALVCVCVAQIPTTRLNGAVLLGSAAPPAAVTTFPGSKCFNVSATATKTNALPVAAGNLYYEGTPMIPCPGFFPAVPPTTSPFEPAGKDCSTVLNDCALSPPAVDAATGLPSPPAAGAYSNAAGSKWLQWLQLGGTGALIGPSNFKYGGSGLGTTKVGPGPAIAAGTTVVGVLTADTGGLYRKLVGVINSNTTYRISVDFCTSKHDVAGTPARSLNEGGVVRLDVFVSPTGLEPNSTNPFPGGFTTPLPWRDVMDGNAQALARTNVSRTFSDVRQFPNGNPGIFPQLNNDAVDTGNVFLDGEYVCDTVSVTFQHYELFEHVGLNGFSVVVSKVATGTEVFFNAPAVTATPISGCDPIFINEIEYVLDGTGGQVEGIEVAGPHGASLAKYSYALIDNNGGIVFQSSIVEKDGAGNPVTPLVFRGNPGDSYGFIFLQFAQADDKITGFDNDGQTNTLQTTVLVDGQPTISSISSYTPSSTGVVTTKAAGIALMNAAGAVVDFVCFGGSNYANDRLPKLVFKTVTCTVAKDATGAPVVDQMAAAPGFTIQRVGCGNCKQHFNTWKAMPGTFDPPSRNYDTGGVTVQNFCLDRDRDGFWEGDSTDLDEPVYWQRRLYDEAGVPLSTLTPIAPGALFGARVHTPECMCLGNDCQDNYAHINVLANEICDGFDSDCSFVNPAAPTITDSIEPGQRGEEGLFAVDGTAFFRNGVLRDPDADPTISILDTDTDELDRDGDGRITCDGDCDDNEQTVGGVAGVPFADLMAGDLNLLRQPIPAPDSPLYAPKTRARNNGVLTLGVPGSDAIFGKATRVIDNVYCVATSQPVLRNIAGICPSSTGDAAKEVCDGVDNDCVVDPLNWVAHYVDEDLDYVGTNRLPIGDRISGTPFPAGPPNTFEKTFRNGLPSYENCRVTALSDPNDPDSPLVTIHPCDELGVCYSPVNTDCDDTDYFTKPKIIAWNDENFKPVTEPWPQARCTGADNDCDATTLDATEEVCDGIDNDCNGNLFHLDVFGGNTANLNPRFDVDNTALRGDGVDDGLVFNNDDDYVTAEGVGLPEDRLYLVTPGDFGSAPAYAFLPSARQACLAVLDPAEDRVGLLLYPVEQEDCKDDDDAIYPQDADGTQDETDCDRLDNDCDGLVDEGLWIDSDNDQYPKEVAAACSGSYIHFNQPDCNDANRAINPGALEIICDNIDNNCDGNGENDREDLVVDEDFDGFFAKNPDPKINAACAAQGFVLNDCNDDPENQGFFMNPGRTELEYARFNKDGDFCPKADGTEVSCLRTCGAFGDCLDNNCNGEVDEGVNTGVVLDLSSEGLVGVEFSESRKRGVEGHHSSSSSSSSSTSSHERCQSNAVILVRLTNNSPNTAHNIIIKGAMTLPKKRVTLPQYVFGDLVNYGVKVDENSLRVAWVQFSLAGHSHQEVEFHICVDELTSSSSSTVSTTRSIDTSGIGLSLEIKSVDELVLGGKNRITI